jgi:hypothetical protein
MVILFYQKLKKECLTTSQEQKGKCTSNNENSVLELTGEVKPDFRVVFLSHFECPGGFCQKHIPSFGVFEK